MRRVGLWLIPVVLVLATGCSIAGKWSLAVVEPEAARRDFEFGSLTLQKDGSFYAESLRQHVERLALARWDQLRVGVRDRFLLLAAKAIGVAAGLALSIAGAVYVMHGAALGLASACGSLWLGYVLAGLLFVVGSVLSVLTVSWYLRVRALRRMERKYAARDSVVPSGSNGRPRARARAGVSRARGE